MLRTGAIAISREVAIHGDGGIAYESRIVDSILMLLLVVPLVTGLGLVFWRNGRWFELVAGLGLAGLSVAGWIDLADNCTFSTCDENDPAALTAGWAASVVLLACGGAGVISNVFARRSAAQRHDADGSDCMAGRIDDDYF